MKKYFIAAMVLLAVGLYLSTKYIGEEVAEPEPNVPSKATARQTSDGPVIGYADKNNTHAWLGIPFAKPPVGELRWKAPRANPGQPAWRYCTLGIINLKKECVALLG